MDFNYTKIKIGNWLYRNCFPLYKISYTRFKKKTDAVEIATLKELIRPGDHILDIGANIGFYSRLLAEWTGNSGKVYAFEPDKTNFSHLKKATVGIANIVLFNKAVSDKEETLKIYKSKLLNVDHRTYPVNNYESVEEIEAVSIDGLMTKGLIPKVDLIKIDIQGYEMVAFKGMKDLLTNTKNVVVVAEFWPHGFKRAGSSAIAFYDFFDAMGFSFSLISDDGTRPLERSYVEANNDGPFEFSYNVLIQRR